MTEHSILLIGGNENESAIVVSFRSSESCHLSLSFRGKNIEVGAADYFDAFCQIRLQLEAESLIPCCYGASLNVYPSGMSREMSHGITAYRRVLGMPSTRESLVHIFKSGDDVTPASVVEQRAFFDKWTASLRA